jgi:Zn finger protein HypA/HybF involved in hydrogenase expression
MPYLWSMNAESEWVPTPVADQPVELVEIGEVNRVTLSHAEDGRVADSWVLLWGPNNNVRLNGLRLQTGVRVLADRDEVKVDSHPPVFFSAETLVEVETFESGENELYCPRCKKPVEEGTSIVRCPACKLAYHYSEDKERNCWNYSTKCTCGHSTAMDAGFQWTPYEIWG